MYYVVLITADGMHHQLPEQFGSEQLAKKTAQKYVVERVCEAARVVKRTAKKDVPVAQYRLKSQNMKENTKNMKYDRKTINEAIDYWQEMLSETLLAETVAGDNDHIPKEDVKAFVDGMAKEVAGLLERCRFDENDGYAEINADTSVNDIKCEIYKFISRLKTKEDIRLFIKNNEAQMKSIVNDERGVPSKLKKYLGIIWKVLKACANSTLWALEHLKTLAVIAAVAFVCVKFGVTPTEAIKKGVNAAKLMYKAADVTVTGAKKTADVITTARDASESFGEKIGRAIGGAWQNAENTINGKLQSYKETKRPVSK